MANGYKVGEAITVTYQADNLKSGETVTMVIYDETGTNDTVNFPDVVMTELGSSGRYQGTFIPDEVGPWVVMISYGNDKGGVVKQYNVGNFNIDDVGQTVNEINAKVVDSFPMVG